MSSSFGVTVLNTIPSATEAQVKTFETLADLCIGEFMKENIRNSFRMEMAGLNEAQTLQVCIDDVTGELGKATMLDEGVIQVPCPGENTDSNEDWILTGFTPADWKDCFLIHVLADGSVIAIETEDYPVERTGPNPCKCQLYELLDLCIVGP